MCVCLCLLTAQERVESLNEKLDLVLSGGEKFTDSELFAEGGSSKPGYSKKQCKLMHCIKLLSVHLFCVTESNTWLS